VQNLFAVLVFRRASDGKRGNIARSGRKKKSDEDVRPNNNNNRENFGGRPKPPTGAVLRSRENGRTSVGDETPQCGEVLTHVK